MRRSTLLRSGRETDDAGTPGAPLPALARRAVSPVAIVGGVLLVLHRQVFGGMADSLAGDPLGFFLPRHCFLGTALVEGNIPLWNPHVMGGTPFAADPQSGWMYLPAMLLYWLLPCSTAFGWYVALHPILAGLGVSWFLRAEGRSRAAATLGGLALALPMAGSSIAYGSLPFAGATAWTAVALAAASKYRRARTWSGGLLWVTALSVSWGQLAAAHMSTGLVLGSLLVGLYLGAGLVSDVRRGEVPWRTAAAKSGLLLVVLPIVSAAILLPRSLYLPRTTLGFGYDRLGELTGSASNLEPGTFGRGLSPAWLLTLGRAPGYYLGAAVVLAAVAWIDAGIRRTALPFVAFAIFCLVASLRPAADLLAPLRHTPVGTFYLHSPGRMLYGVLVCLAVLIGLGLDASTRQPRRRREVVAGLVAVVLWASLPLTQWRDVSQVISSVGTASMGFLPLVPTGRRRFRWMATGALGSAFLLAAVWGHTAFLRPEIGPLRVGRPPSEPPAHARTTMATFLRPRPPDIRVAVFLDQGPIAGNLARQRGGRYISVNPELTFPSGYHAQRRGWWGLLASEQSMVFGLEEAQGYNPVQLPRYWTLLRTVDPKPIHYNRGWFLAPSAAAFDVLHIGWVVGASRPDLPVRLVDTGVEQAVWHLYRVTDAPPRASVETEWSVAASPRAALERVTDPSFGPGEVVVEGRPEMAPSGSVAGGRATFRWLDMDTARIEVEAPAPAVVLVRNTWDRNWRARVDGRQAAVLPANYLVQGIAVPEGRHGITLEYSDPSVGLGLAISMASVGVLLTLGIALRARERRRRLA